jgi:hypothetical protein
MPFGRRDIIGPEHPTTVPARFKGDGGGHPNAPRPATDEGHDSTTS